MAKDFLLAIRGGRIDLFASKLGRETDCDDFLIAVTVPDVRYLHGYFECRHGGIDDFNYPGCEHDFLGCNRQLLDDFLDKLPCQLSRS